jgi:tRNA dimethylallyltransferase
MKKTCIIITGPTAVGKTAISILLAKHFNTSIISADSRQCYKEMNIGVAKPSEIQLREVKHYFINSHSITKDISAADFEQYALTSVAEIFTTNDIAIMVGGTGLYIKAFCQGLDNIPSIDPQIRTQIINDYEAKGIEWLQKEIKEKDPRYFADGEIQNPQRMMRALEVKLSTGTSIREFQQGVKAKRDFNIIMIGLELPKELLHQQINQRVDDMMKEGLLEEVESLYDKRSLNALQTVGYSELFRYLDKEISLNEAIELIKRNTRHYAKRQITWFKRSANQQNFDPRNSTSLLNFVEKKLQDNL